MGKREPKKIVAVTRFDLKGDVHGPPYIYDRYKIDQLRSSVEFAGLRGVDRQTIFFVHDDLRRASAKRQRVKMFCWWTAYGLFVLTMILTNVFS